MKEYYHYTLENKVNDILRTGVFSNDYNFTTDQYYTSYEAGDALGVMPHYIECVLLFTDDGLFESCGIVPSGHGGYLSGGGIQYQHPFRPKPVAKRKIFEKNWILL